VVDGGKDRFYLTLQGICMSCLPDHGRIDCSRCFKSTTVEFDKTKCGEGDWRITANPLAWGNTEAEIVVLGFSKGPYQAGALSHAPHNEIAYKRGRKNVGKILSHIGLLKKGNPDALKQDVDHIISDKGGRFHFGSLIRCTVERYDHKAQKWKGSGGGMLDKFVATQFGKLTASSCTTMFLSDLPVQTKLVIMFGLGTKCNYVDSAFDLFKNARLGNWEKINDIAYTDGRITVVHVEHFASQGALIPNWLGEKAHDRQKLGNMAIDAVHLAL